MKQFIDDHFDRIAIIFVMIIVCFMWVFRGNQFTEQIVRDAMIAIIAYLTGKSNNSKSGL
jgi:hypothetical protein